MRLADTCISIPIYILTLSPKPHIRLFLWVDGMFTMKIRKWYIISLKNYTELKLCEVHIPNYKEIMLEINDRMLLRNMQVFRHSDFYKLLNKWKG